MRIERTWPGRRQAAQLIFALILTLGTCSIAFSQGVYPGTTPNPVPDGGTPDTSRPSGENPPSSSTDQSSPFAVTNSMNVLDDTRPLGIGDVLAFRVVEDNAGLRSLIITDSGEVEVPYIGRVYAKGKTCKSLANLIKGELEKSYYQKATVIIGLDWAGSRMRGDQSSYLGDKIHVWGEVRREGAIPLAPGDKLKVTEAILKAGGFTPFAKRDAVRIIRDLSTAPGNGGETLPPPQPKKGFFKRLFGGKSKAPENTQELLIDVKRIMEKGDIRLNIILQPNDIIIVDEKLVNL